MQRFIPWVGSLLLLTVPACGKNPPSTREDAPLGLDLIQLPDDFGPEGIAVGNGSKFYVGSLNPNALGQILVGDIRTGALTPLVAPTGRPALGMKHDARRNTLFVAGGPSGGGTVYDADSGAEIASYQFGSPPSMVNDVVVTRQAAFFTDSELAFLYRVAISPDGRPGSATAMALPDNFAKPGSCAVGPPLKANGIAATPTGDYLILAHMSEGRLYRMDPTSGEVRAITLTGGDVCAADGLLLDGNKLYVVQNFLNRVAVIDVARDYLSGVVSRYITEPFGSNPGTRVPTTIAGLGGSLYAVTAGFAPPAPDYVVRLSK